MKQVKKVSSDLDIKRVAITCGITLAAVAFVLGAYCSLYGIGSGLVAILSTVWHGYGPSPFGVGAGVVWGLVHGGLIGALLAWVYNKLG